MAKQELQLRPLQVETMEAVREALRQGNRKVLLYGPTGFGKTEMAIAFMQAADKLSNRSAMILDRIVLCNQTSARLDKYDIPHGVMQSGHWRYRPHERIQVCSAQTIEKRGDFPGLRLLIVDECFPGETLVDTPDGPVRIDTLTRGSRIYNATGLAEVQSVFSTSVHCTLLLRLSDGSTIESTPDHPFFTSMGWKPAGSLEVGQELFRREAVQALWQRHAAGDGQLDEGRAGAGGGDAVSQARMLRSVLREEIEEPDDASGVSEQGFVDAAAYRALSVSQGWQWVGADEVGGVAVGKVAGGRMGCRFSGTDFDGAAIRVSVALQAGHCESDQEDLHRTGWRKSWVDGQAGSGQEEGCAFARVRLESVEAIEHQVGRTVFNLRVSKHPSYFANGVLVHNCHQQRKMTTEFINNNEKVIVIGLSASPFTEGLGDTYDVVVSSVTTQQLVDKGLLAPLRVFIAKQIDMKGAKKIAGEWSDGAAAERGKKITGDVVAEWEKKTFEIFGRARKTIVFCADVAHGADLAEKFAAAGFNFIPISYKSDDKFKADAIADFAKPDTKIDGLIACDILTKGFDVSDVMIGVSARPFTKSFSSHVQQMGRVMRAHEGKEFALWLDFSGNYLRFRDDWEEVYAAGVQELSSAKEVAHKEPTEKEFEAGKCPKCGALWPRESDTCSGCGHTRLRRSMLELVAGEMEELKGSAKSRDEKQRWFSELIGMQHERGYKNGYASNKYREKFGVWPSGLNELPTPVSSEVRGWVKSRQIAWSKSGGAR